MNEFQPISPDDRGGHFAAKAEGDSDAALSRLGAAKRLVLGAEVAHVERMLGHALEWIAENVASVASHEDLKR